MVIITSSMSEVGTFLTTRDRAVEEARWVDRVRMGDESAMTLIMDRHRRRIVQVAANILRDANEAEDVAQDSFLRAFREISRLKEDRAFPGYLYRICVRACMDRLRNRKPSFEVLDVPVASPGSSVETKVLVERLLNLLSPEMRATLVLREMEQFSYDEVAEATGVPVGTVRSRLHVARERFRQLWLDANGGSS
jgi:RNA polymerase sigma-70 factor (ECF subfamily)